MKLCTFQGTFNPFHKAHEAMAKYVLENFCYDKMLLIPAYCPPHKQDKRSNSKIRFEMTKAYTDKHAEFEISDIEFKRNEPSYTFVTITQLYELFEIEERIGFIIGEDSFLQIESWYQADKLKKLVDFIVFPRDNNIEQQNYSHLQKKGYCYTIANHQPLAISSTKIRNMISQQQNFSGIEKFVPPEIKEYIEKNELYI